MSRTNGKFLGSAWHFLGGVRVGAIFSIYYITSFGWVGVPLGKMLCSTDTCRCIVPCTPPLPGFGSILYIRLREARGQGVVTIKVDVNQCVILFYNFATTVFNSSTI